MQCSVAACRRKNGLNWFGPVMYAETLTWLGLDHEQIVRHRNHCAHLRPLSECMLEFLSPDFPSSAALPKNESSYRYYVFAWNLAGKLSKFKAFEQACCTAFEWEAKPLF
jgi:hypothetical protein